jgi:hypothetical protein
VTDAKCWVRRGCRTINRPRVLVAVFGTMLHGYHELGALTLIHDEMRMQSRS